MRALMLSTVLLLSACRPQPESLDRANLRIGLESAAAHTAIDAINIRYQRYMNENLVDSVASLFMESAVMMPPNARAVIGKENIRQWFAENPIPAGASYTFAAVEVTANGPVVVELGDYNFSMPAAGKVPAVSVNGKYVVHWRNVNGRWLQAATIWNEDTPVSQ